MNFSNHFNDENGNPAGGTSFGTGYAIGWQNGPLGRPPERTPPDGAIVEDIIHAAIDRLEFYQKSFFKCEANADALVHLQRAVDVLNKRTAERESRQVEGKHSL